MQHAERQYQPARDLVLDCPASRTSTFLFVINHPASGILLWQNKTDEDNMQHQRRTTNLEKYFQLASQKRANFPSVLESLQQIEKKKINSPSRNEQKIGTDGSQKGKEKYLLLGKDAPSQS